MERVASAEDVSFNFKEIKDVAKFLEDHEAHGMIADVTDGSIPSAPRSPVRRRASAIFSPGIQPEARSVKRSMPAYTPWPEDVMYIPGVGDAPPLKPRTKYGEVPEVGDVPRIGARDGDPRCEDRAGYRPCQGCVYEAVDKQMFAGKVMPGQTKAEAQKVNPFTGIPFGPSHPFRGPTSAMNTGRGCDMYGIPYLPPPRYLYLNIHRFEEEYDDWEKTKTYEIDFGPDVDSEEFREGLQAWKDSDDFGAYAERMKAKNLEWEWKDPVSETPWATCQLVDPNPWLTDDYVVKDPLQQHVDRIREWAAKEHEPWPSWPGEGTSSEDPDGLSADSAETSDRDDAPRVTA